MNMQLPEDAVPEDIQDLLNKIMAGKGPGDKNKELQDFKEKLQEIESESFDSSDENGEEAGDNEGDEGDAGGEQKEEPKKEEKEFSEKETKSPPPKKKPTAKKKTAPKKAAKKSSKSNPNLIPIRDSEGNKVKMIFHKDLPKIRNLCKLKLSGWPVGVWLYGPAGCGKSMIGRQVARLLNKKVVVYGMGPTTSEYESRGFKNTVSGDYVEGFLYRPYKEGWFAVCDEADVAESSALTSFNALLSDPTYTFPNGETVKRHPDFQMFIGANTNGSGSTAGYIRNRIDKAFLDRFLKVYVDYDEDLEIRISGYREAAVALQKLRKDGKKRIRHQGFSVTTRDIMHFSTVVRDGGFPVMEAAKMTFANDLPEQDLPTVESFINHINPRKPTLKPKI